LDPEAEFPFANVEVGRAWVEMLELDAAMFTPVAQEILVVEKLLYWMPELVFVDSTAGRVVVDVISIWLVIEAPIEEGVFNENIDRPLL
jgi:hypothetical protein